MDQTKILIVEDEAIVALDIKHILTKLGYTIVGTLSRGEDVAPTVTAQKPHLVLMDIKLAGTMDGIEAAKYLQSHDPIPVVYLTANADFPTLERAKQTQPFGYVIKPFQTKDLQTAIEIALARHQAEQNLRQLAAKEAELRRLKSRFLSMATHDLRNPLTYIMTSTGLLEMLLDQSNHPQVSQHLQKINHAVEVMTQLLDEVTEIEAVEAGSLTFSPSLINLDRWLSELIKDMQDTANPRQIRFKFQSEPGVESGLVAIDTYLLHRIMSNLLSNAIKYSPRGGMIECYLHHSLGTATIAIQDHGIGIPKAEQEQLFQAFFRGSNVEDISGTGLGLAIVKQCVDLHQGEITVESEMGQGTCFTLMLPCQTPH
jgi:signal transduction histidine kinase